MKVLEYVCFLLGKTLLSVSEKDGLQKERECVAWRNTPFSFIV